MLLVWFSTHDSDDVSAAAEELRSKVGATGHVLLENVERITLGSKIDIKNKNTTTINYKINCKLRRVITNCHIYYYIDVTCRTTCIHMWSTTCTFMAVKIFDLPNFNN